MVWIDFTTKKICKKKKKRDQSFLPQSQDYVDSSSHKKSMSRSQDLAPPSREGLLYLNTAYQGDNGQHILRKEAATIQTKSSPLILEKRAK